MTSPLNLTFQTTSISDIFEVNINSNKLISILKHLQQSNKKLQKKIQRIEDFYQQGDSLLNKKINNLQNSIKDVIKHDLIDIKKQIQLDMRKHQEKYIKELINKETKINQLKYSMQTLNQKINKINNNLTEQIDNSVRNSSGQLHTLKRNFQKQSELIQGGIQQLAQKLDNCVQQSQNNKQNIFDLQVKLKKYIQNSQRPFDANIIHDKEKKFEDCVNAQKYTNIALQNQSQAFQRSRISNNSPVKQSHLSNKKYNKKTSLGFSSSNYKKNKMFTTMDSQHKTSNENYMSTLQYASISAKVQTLQKKLKQNSQKMNDTNNDTEQGFFKRGGKTNMMKTFSYSKQKGQKMSQNLNRISEINLQQMSDFQILSNIMLKLQQIQKAMSYQQRSLKEMIQKIRQKQITNSQRIDYLKQKNHKTNNQISQIKIKILKLQKKASPQQDTRTITSIQAQLGKIIQRIDKQIPLKMDLQIFNEQKNKLYDRFTYIQQNLIYKAQKEDVKKAINFLQDKIKQIILVMANQFNEQKLGAITKAPKCLTCDRDVIKLQNLNHSASNNALKTCNSASTLRQSGQKYYTRLLKSKRQSKDVKKKYQNYTSATIVTEEKQEM